MVLYCLFQEIASMSLFQKAVMTILQTQPLFQKLIITACCYDYPAMATLLCSASVRLPIRLPNPPFGDHPLTPEQSIDDLLNPTLRGDSHVHNEKTLALLNLAI